jgi:hypothetical protein
MILFTSSIRELPRIKEDTENIMNAICFGFMLFMEQSVYFVVASVVLFSINWKLALISLITMPVIEFVVFKLERSVLPPHRAPDVVSESGLTAENGWMTVDRATLETAYPNVFAVGDVMLIPLSSGLPLPKAGVLAELEGQRPGAARCPPH